MLAAAALAVAAAASASAVREVDPAHSELTATFRQMNAPVQGRFTAFHGVIAFDPARPAAARARLDVDTASFTIGAPEYDEEARSREWLDVAGHPRATFESSSVRADGAGGYVAAGTLTLKGVAVPLEIPFTSRKTRSAQIYEGAFSVSRQVHGIGDPDWDDVLDDTVIIRFRIASKT